MSDSKSLPIPVGSHFLYSIRAGMNDWFMSGVKVMDASFIIMYQINLFVITIFFIIPRLFCWITYPCLLLFSVSHSDFLFGYFSHMCSKNYLKMKGNIIWLILMKETPISLLFIILISLTKILIYFHSVKYFFLFFYWY